MSYVKPITKGLAFVLVSGSPSFFLFLSPFVPLSQHPLNLLVFLSTALACRRCARLCVCVCVSVVSVFIQHTHTHTNRDNVLVPLTQCIDHVPLVLHFFGLVGPRRVHLGLVLSPHQSLGQPKATGGATLWLPLLIRIWPRQIVCGRRATGRQCDQV